MGLLLLLVNATLGPTTNWSIEECGVPDVEYWLVCSLYDCLHSCGDHRAVDCPKKDRLCGNAKTDRGCSQQHKMHKLFCPAAKCFSIQQVYSVDDADSSDGVVLLIMSVKNQRRGQVSSVFWDLGCTSNFVREQHARQCGFKGIRKQLSVTTLGGVTTD